MRKYHTWITAGLASIVLLNLGLSFTAVAAPRDIRREIREGAREIRRERREAIREIRRANSPAEVRREIREGRREVRRERREVRREVRREIRQEVRNNRWNNRWNRWERYQEVRQDIRNTRIAGLFLGILGSFIGGAIAQSSSGAVDDVQLEEAIQRFGYVSGAAFQCAGKSPQYEKDAIDIFNSMNQLYGENRATIYANAFDTGSTDPIDRTQCGTYVRQFRDAIQKGALNR